ncbi:hypothetical protein BCR39DRAFT_540826 [Naematelia encephala]|uniref:Uncharacterized protein n=1 Tax=Naematelia encephala TaxID=71784 RepID=A0A1Y2AVI3_9TREE|nr:hypothetical protein BCR39DRAFT_540826 [Naematelia encephala]
MRLCSSNAAYRIFEDMDFPYKVCFLSQFPRPNPQAPTPNALTPRVNPKLQPVDLQGTYVQLA